MLAEEQGIGLPTTNATNVEHSTSLLAQMMYRTRRYAMLT